MSQRTATYAALARSVRALRPVLETAEAAGIDVEAALVDAGLDPAVIREGDVWLNHDDATRILASVFRRAEGIPIGLRAVERLRLGDGGLFDYLLYSSETLREAAQLATRFFGLLDNSLQLRLTEDGRNASFAVLPCVDAFILPELAVFAIAMFTKHARRLTDRDLSVIEVRLVQKQPATSAAIERFFRAPIRYEAAVDEIVFPRVFLDLPLPNGDAKSREILQIVAIESLRCRPSPTSFVDRLKHLIAEGIREGGPGVDSLARKISTSRRTLQRRLEESGTTMQSLLDEARCYQALQYIGYSDGTLGEIALKLGFASPSAFSRAFRRWTAMPPGVYRQSMRAGKLPDVRSGAFPAHPAPAAEPAVHALPKE